MGSEERGLEMAEELARTNAKAKEKTEQMGRTMVEAEDKMEQLARTKAEAKENSEEMAKREIEVKEVTEELRTTWAAIAQNKYSESTTHAGGESCELKSGEGDKHSTVLIYLRQLLSSGRLPLSLPSSAHH